MQFSEADALPVMGSSDRLKMCEALDDSSNCHDSGIRVRTIEVQWHYSAPSAQDADRHGLQGQMEGIISIDFHPNLSRFLTAGGDSSIMLWHFNTPHVEAWLSNAAEDMTKCCEWVTTLRCHDMPRCARWSPSGQIIASGHSDPRIRLWWRIAKEDLNREVDGQECWKDMRVLTGHLHDVMDLAFSPDSRYLVSAGMYGSVLVHDLDATVPVVSIEAHNKFCYGVAWDPWNRLVASFGGGPGLMLHSVAPASEHRRLQLVGQRRSQSTLFHGEGYSSSMRRLSWSPDGSMLAVPFGKNVAPGVDPEMRQCVAIYMRSQAEASMRIAIRGPSEIRGALWAPGFMKPPKVDPNMSQNSMNNKAPWGPSDFRMALAAWTEETVVVYTTDMGARHSDFSDLHVLSISDVSWSPDGRFLLTCSLDGYVTVLHYSNGILGPAYALPTAFSESPISRGVSQIRSTFSDASRQNEMKKTAIVAGNPQSTTTSSAVVVKKKRRVDAQHTAAPTVEVSPVVMEMGIADLEQLIDI